MYFTLIIVFAAYAVGQMRAEQCKTPNNEPADCISLYSCPLLLKALGSQQNTSIEFVRKSSCGGTPAEPKVCCGSSSTFIVSEKNNSAHDRNQNVTKANLIPSRSYCGLQHSDDYFSTSIVTAITEFPWLAWVRHEYIDTGTNAGFLCSGSLINIRYVLTVAHCLKGRESIAVEVRLGEYNRNNDTDCTEDSQFYECSSPPKDFRIEKSIPHPNFSILTGDNDIALLRLNKKVEYSDYIRPICLPFPGTKFANIGDVLTSSGWGSTSYVGDAAIIKKKSLGRLISNEECAEQYKDTKKPITNNQLCTIQLNNTDSQCQGDTGGPVMFSHRAQWHQEGIVSRGKACGFGFADVQTRVVNYLNWIVENVEP